MEPINGRLEEKANTLTGNADYSFRYLPKSELDKLPEYIRIIYNKAWANRADTPELSDTAG